MIFTEGENVTNPRRVTPEEEYFVGKKNALLDGGNTMIFTEGENVTNPSGVTPGNHPNGVVFLFAVGDSKDIIRQSCGLSVTRAGPSETLIFAGGKYVTNPRRVTPEGEYFVGKKNALLDGGNTMVFTEGENVTNPSGSPRETNLNGSFFLEF